MVYISEPGLVSLRKVEIKILGLCVFTGSFELEELVGGKKPLGMSMRDFQHWVN